MYKFFMLESFFSAVLLNNCYQVLEGDSLILYQQNSHNKVVMSGVLYYKKKPVKRYLSCHSWSTTHPPTLLHAWKQSKNSNVLLP